MKPGIIAKTTKIAISFFIKTPPKFCVKGAANDYFCPLFIYACPAIKKGTFFLCTFFKGFLRVNILRIFNTNYTNTTNLLYDVFFLTLKNLRDERLDFLEKRLRWQSANSWCLCG